jgi:hypothetical protein
MANKISLYEIFTVFGTSVEDVFDLIDELLTDHKIVWTFSYLSPLN